jgi:hypothetical protein
VGASIRIVITGSVIGAATVRVHGRHKVTHRQVLAATLDSAVSAVPASGRAAVRVRASARAIGRDKVAEAIAPARVRAADRGLAVEENEAAKLDTTEDHRTEDQGLRTKNGLRT